MGLIKCRCSANPTNNHVPLPAEEGLPGGVPPLLQHLALCQTSLQADFEAWSLEATAGPAAEAAGGGSSDSKVCGSLPSPLRWAQPLSETLLALSVLLAEDRAVTHSTAEAICSATKLLITHQMGTRQPLLQPGTDRARAAAPHVFIRAPFRLRPCGCGGAAQPAAVPGRQPGGSHRRLGDYIPCAHGRWCR